ncbi:hypothetical protein EIZ39_12570 [Ammoniphilus sp. CFH 90114]|nr:hypothetical protein EIZ39_12570 [Ammoniphilus sp. CFH 90114]
MSMRTYDPLLTLKPAILSDNGTYDSLLDEDRTDEGLIPYNKGLYVRKELKTLHFYIDNGFYVRHRQKAPHFSLGMMDKPSDEYSP